MIETRDCDVLEYLDHNGGSASVADLHKRGAPVNLIRELEIRELVSCDDVRVQLTDRGAAAIEGPVEPVESPPAEPEPQEEPMETRTLEEHRSAQTNGNGGGTTRERILGLLAEHPDGLRPGRVAELLGLGRRNVNGCLLRLVDDDAIERVLLGADHRSGVLYFLAGEAKVPSAPDLKATTKPKPRAKPKSRAPVKAEAVKPPPLRSRVARALPRGPRAPGDDRGPADRGRRAPGACARARREGARLSR